MHPIIQKKWILTSERPDSIWLAACFLSTVLGVTDVRAAVTDEQSASASLELQEVVVTATRQESPLSKVPISVSTLTGEQLASRGITNVEDIMRTVPGVEFDRVLGPVTSISIRGIASSSGAATTGVYLDDTPIQVRLIGQGQTVTNPYPNVFDLERVEILRGPQGTLFGAGSEGGTVRFITPQPSLTTSSGYTREEISFTQNGDPSYETGIAAGGPVVDETLGFRVSAYYRRDGGYIDRVDFLTGSTSERDSNWQKSGSFRAALAYAPTDGVKITPAVYYQKTDMHDKGAYWAFLSSPSNGTFNDGAQVPEPTYDHFVLPSVDVSITKGIVDIHSTTSFLDRVTRVYQNYSNFIPVFLGATVTPQLMSGPLAAYSNQGADRNTQRSFTQEIRVSSNDAAEPFRWTAGLFFERAKQQAFATVPDSEASFDALTEGLFGLPGAQVWGLPLIPCPNTFAGSQMCSYINRDDGTDQQLAGFGDARYQFTEKLSLDVGVRIARTKFTETTYQNGAINGGLSSSFGSESETPVTPKVNVSYQIEADDLLYATASKGYRVGGANGPLPPACDTNLQSLGYQHGAPSTYRSDNVWSYEIGNKIAFLDRRIRIATSAYLINWNDIQQTVNLVSCGLAFVDNLGRARSKGADVSFEAQVTPDVAFALTAGYTSASFTKTLYGAPTTAGAATVIINKGDDVGFNDIGPSPWLVSASLEQKFRVGTHKFTGRIDDDYQSAASRHTPEFDQSTTLYFARAFARRATNLVNGRVTANLEQINVSLFANNIFNAHPQLNRVNLGPQSNLIDEFTTLRPRTLGVNFEYRF